MENRSSSDKLLAVPAIGLAQAPRAQLSSRDDGFPLAACSGEHLSRCMVVVKHCRIFSLRLVAPWVLFELV